MLTVSGCRNNTVAAIIEGGFLHNGSNHGKPVFKKEPAPGGQGPTVLIYFWDERDGANFSGWWFGPKVGGDQVWAYNSKESSSGPPTTGWRVPWDGAVDESLRVVLHAPGGGGGRDAPPDSGRGPVAVPPRDGRQRQDPPGRHDDDDRRGGGRGGDRERVDDRRRLEDEQRRRDDDARRRREDQERQQKEELRRREREEEQRRVREEELQRQQKEEKRRREEAEKRRAEEDKRREEEDKRRRKEEERRRAEEEKRKAETAVALSVRKVIQRVRVAGPDTFDGLRNELEDALSKNLASMGPHGHKVTEEAEQTLRQAQRRIDEEKEKIAEEQKRKEEEEKRRQEEQAQVEQIMQEAADQLKSGEGLLKDVKEAAEKIPEGKDAEPQSVVTAVDAASSVYEESQAGLEIVLDWFAQKKQELSKNHASRTQVMDFGEMIGKLDEGKRALLANMEKGKSAKELAARRAAAIKKTKARRELFEARDLDKDGKLSRDEVVAFSKEVHSFDVPSEVLAKIMLVLEPVTFEKFHALRQKVAIAKIEVDARAARAKLDAERKTFQLVVDEVAKHVEAAETAVAQAEDDAKPLRRDHELQAAEMKSIAEKAQGLVAQAEEELKRAGEKFEDADKLCASNPGLDFANRGSLKHRQERTQTRAERVASTMKRATEQAVEKIAVEVDEKLTESVAASRKLMCAENKTAEQIFEGLGGGILSVEKFAEFVKSLPDFKISDEQTGLLYAGVAGGPDAKMGQEQFCDMLRLYYKVVKGTVLADGLSIKTKTVKRLEGGETLECLEGPQKDDSCGVQRVKCKVIGDDTVGWVTLQGNQGTPFLVQDGNFMTIRKRLAAEKAVEDARREAEQKAAEKVAAEEAEKAAEKAAAEEKEREEKEKAEKEKEEREKVATEKAAAAEKAAAERAKPMVVDDDEGEKQPAAAAVNIEDDEEEDEKKSPVDEKKEEEKKEEDEKKEEKKSPVEQVVEDVAAAAEEAAVEEAEAEGREDKAEEGGEDEKEGDGEGEDEEPSPKAKAKAKGKAAKAKGKAPKGKAKAKGK